MSRRPVDQAQNSSAMDAFASISMALEAINTAHGLLSNDGVMTRNVSRKNRTRAAKEAQVALVALADFLSANDYCLHQSLRAAPPPPSVQRAQESHA